MNKPAVAAIFDVGKTNKKFLLIDTDYRVVEEVSTQIAEIQDEDGYPCENIELLGEWVLSKTEKIISREDIDLRAINISAYGASFALLNEDGYPIAPLYNYLKPYPEYLQDELFDQYGGGKNFSLQTASPVLGNLNSGLQLYRLKKENPELFEKLSCALHLPQYLSYLITRESYSDISSIGCHTMLWDYSRNHYHDWVYREGIFEKLAPVFPSTDIIGCLFKGRNLICGVGLHDSSAALIPYQALFRDPFILLSTGTWSITLNPFNKHPLTVEELEQDCLCYLDYKGNPVKAARLFAGHEHDQQVRRIAAHFNTREDFYREIHFNRNLVMELLHRDRTGHNNMEHATESNFGQRSLSDMQNSEIAYHRLMMDLVDRQVKAIRLVLPEMKSERVFIDGGFSNNDIFMKLMALSLPEHEVYAAALPQASAIGAAMVIHPHWNTQPVPRDFIRLKNYSSAVASI